MPASLITKKGQITVPKEIRAYLRLFAGNKVEFLIENGKVIFKTYTIEACELKRVLPKTNKIVTVEQMNKAIVKRGSSL